MGSTRRRIKQAFDPKRLAELTKKTDFTDEGLVKYDTNDGPGRFFWHRPSDAPILAVAHLDSVQDPEFCDIVNTSQGPVVFSPVLDDRLGVYVILDLLPKLGLEYDVLLTTDEETCRSTASQFRIDKQYNWIFEFDRMGTDVVLYDYQTMALKNLVEASGAKVGNGSVSDISYLEHLKCKAMNWGVGYQNYHSTRAYAFLSDTFMMIESFLRFHKANADTLLTHEKLVRPNWQNWSSGYYSSRADSSRYEKWLKGHKAFNGPDKDDEIIDVLPGLALPDESESLITLEQQDKEVQEGTRCPQCFRSLEEGWCDSCGVDWHIVFDVIGGRPRADADLTTETYRLRGLLS